MAASHGLYTDEPRLHIPAPFTNESYCIDQLAKACAVLHDIEAEVGEPLECLAPFELAMTPDVAPGSRTPQFPANVATEYRADGKRVPSIYHDWGPCAAADDTSQACNAFVAEHGRMFIYIVEGEYLSFVASKFAQVLERGLSGAYFDLFSYAYGVGWAEANTAAFRYTYDRWDGFSVDLAANWTIARKKADLCLLTAEARAQLVRGIIARSPKSSSGVGPSIVVNDMGMADVIRALPIHHFLEGQMPMSYAQAHLSTPVVLGWTPQYTAGAAKDGKEGSWWRNWSHATNADLLADMRDKLSAGVLYYMYFTKSQLITNAS